MNYKQRAKNVVEKWELTEDSSMRDGFRHTLIDLIEAALKEVSLEAYMEGRIDGQGDTG